MKIYDCFTFFNELELLELRLESLYDVVDRFAIVEADKTHANEPKPFNFYENIRAYEKYLPKIEYVMDTSVVAYKGVGDWSIENNQRNNIMKGLGDAAPDDLIMISDADEFPDPAIVKTIRDSFTDKNKRVDLVAFYDTAPYTRGKLVPFHCGMRINDFLDLSPISFHLRSYLYYFDWQSKLPCEGTSLCKFKHLKSPQELRATRKGLPRIVNGGWHFSYMGGVKRITEKMQAAVEDVELFHENKKYLDKAFVEEAMASGKYFHTAAKFVPCDVSKIKLPALKKFLEKYPHFVRGALNT